MRNTLHLILVGILAIFIFTSNTFAQDSPQWHLPEGAKARLGKGHINEIKYSPDSSTLAVASGIGVWLYDAQTGEELNLFIGHTGSVSSVSFSPDGSTLASGSRDEIRLWNAHTGAHIRTLSGHTWRVLSVSFSPDGNTLASAGGWNDDTVRLWNAHTGAPLRTLSGHTDPVNSVSFSPDGNHTLASGSYDHTIRLWNAHTGAPLRTLSGHTRWVSSVSFSPDGNTLASGGWDHTVRLWNAHTGAPLRTLSGHTDPVNSVSFSPDGNTLASAGGWNAHTVRLWNAHTGAPLRTLSGHTDRVSSVSFSPDGNTLATASWDNTVRLWNPHTGRHIRTLSGHTDRVSNVSFSPDGNYTLASAGSDGTVLLWELAPSATTQATVSLLPTAAQSPSIGEHLTLSLKITDAENIAGYQATVRFDAAALRYVESTNGDYLPEGAFFIPPVAAGNTVTLASSSLTGENNGDGTLATITFEVVAVKASTVTLSDVLLTDSAGGSSVPQTENAEITEPPQLPADVNKDGAVNIVDLTLVASNFGKQGTNPADVNGDGVVNIVDLTLVAAAFGNTAGAPLASWHLHADEIPTRETLAGWLRDARHLNLGDPDFQRGLRVLTDLLKALTPKETALLPNYPNPFNPETWIPYQLATPSNVNISIYAIDGQLVRTLDFGYLPVGNYQSRSRAAYWDGRNALGEPVASGVYFYTLTAGEFTATRQMLIVK